MKSFLKLFLAVIWIMLTGCAGLLRPNITAAYYIDMQPNSYGQATVGSNGTQANSIHASLPSGDAGNAAEAVASDTSSGGKTSRASGLFVNSGNFDRSTDADLSAAYEALNKVKGTTAGQNLTATSGAESPATATSTQNPQNTTTDTTTLALPVAVGQSAPTATADQSKADDSK